MQKELKLLLDSFISGTSIQPLLVNEENLIEIINYLNNSYYSNLEELKETIIPNLEIFETEEKTFKIEKSRELIEKSAIKSSYEFNIFVLREIDKMSIAASNALLKVLEDVPPRLIFLLTSSAKENLLETIKSRILDFCSNSIKSEINSDTKIIIDDFFSNNKLPLITYIYGEKIERHEYIAILEYILCKIENKNNTFLYDKIITGISDIYSSNANPKYILDSIILELNN